MKKMNIGTKKVISASAIMAAAFLGWNSAALATPGVGKLEELYVFDNDPYKLASTMVQGLDGAYYGTALNSGSQGCGIVYKFVISTNTFTDIHDFNCSTEGYDPAGPLVMDSSGAFYGMTNGGGPAKYGSIFKVTTDGTLTVLATNSYVNQFSYIIESGLRFGPDGWLYGTYFGQSNSSQPNAAGYTFKVSTTGQMVQFNTFSNGAGNPAAGLLPLGGKYYGFTSSAPGSFFSIDANGNYQSIWTFGSTNNGFDVGTSPICDSTADASDGTIICTTNSGTSGLYGGVFKINQAGTVVAAAPFPASMTNAGSPNSSGLIKASNGIWYGQTYNGGANNGGTVYSFSETDGITFISDFPNDALSGGSYCKFIQAADGNLYAPGFKGFYRYVLPAVAPSNLTIAPSSTSLNISWSKTQYATSYNVYISSVSGSEDASTPISVSTNSYVANGLTNNQKYFIKVSAVHDGVESVLSAEAQGTPIETSSSSGGGGAFSVWPALGLSMAYLMRRRKKQMSAGCMSR